MCGAGAIDMKKSHLEVLPLTGALGAEVLGVDISKHLDDEVIAEIRQIFLKYCVIFFRDQNLTVEQQKAFAARFGTLTHHPYIKTGGDSTVVEVRREPHDARVIGDEWHSDVSMLAEPPMGSILYGVEIPPVGGDTLFSNQYRAYEALSPGMQRMLDGVKAWHSDRVIANPSLLKTENKERSTRIEVQGDWQEHGNFHPVVRTHPETHRKGLFVNALQTFHFEGMTDAESEGLLSYLFKHANRIEFTCRFRWRQGSVAFWDNRCTNHYAVNDTAGYRRVMRRVQINGDCPQ